MKSFCKIKFGIFLTVGFSRSYFFIMVSAVVVFAAACNQATIFQKNIQMPEGKWNKYDTAIFKFTVTDTINPYNVYLNIRHNTDYQFCNLYVFINTLYPDGSRSRDTLEFLLAAADGRWLGKGFGKIKDNNIMIQRRVSFPLRGIYSVGVEQAMRVNELAGIEDIGISIEKNTD
jgi:gliding motility-associated lipoprotein GldH